MANSRLEETTEPTIKNARSKKRKAEFDLDVDTRPKKTTTSGQIRLPDTSATTNPLTLSPPIPTPNISQQSLHTRRLGYKRGSEEHKAYKSGHSAGEISRHPEPTNCYSKYLISDKPAIKQAFLEGFKDAQAKLKSPGISVFYNIGRVDAKNFGHNKTQQAIENKIKQHIKDLGISGKDAVDYEMAYNIVATDIANRKAYGRNRKSTGTRKIIPAEKKPATLIEEPVEKKAKSKLERDAGEFTNNFGYKKPPTNESTPLEIEQPFDTEQPVEYLAESNNFAEYSNYSYLFFQPYTPPNPSTPDLRTTNESAPLEMEQPVEYVAEPNNFAESSNYSSLFFQPYISPNPSTPDLQIDEFEKMELDQYFNQIDNNGFTFSQ